MLLNVEDLDVHLGDQDQTRNSHFHQKIVVETVHLPAAAPLRMYTMKMKYAIAEIVLQDLLSYWLEQMLVCAKAVVLTVKVVY